MENFHHCSLAHVHFTFRMSVHRPNVADCWWKKTGYWGSLFIPVYPFWSIFIPFYHPCLFLFIRVISFYPWILKMSVKILRHPRMNRHIYFLASRFHSSGSSVEACGNKKMHPSMWRTIKICIHLRPSQRLMAGQKIPCSLDFGLGWNFNHPLNPSKSYL